MHRSCTEEAGAGMSGGGGSSAVTAPMQSPGQERACSRTTATAPTSRWGAAPPNAVKRAYSPMLQDAAHCTGLHAAYDCSGKMCGHRGSCFAAMHGAQGMNTVQLGWCRRTSTTRSSRPTTRAGSGRTEGGRKFGESPTQITYPMLDVSAAHALLAVLCADKASS